MVRFEQLQKTFVVEAGFFPSLHNSGRLGLVGVNAAFGVGFVEEVVAVPFVEAREVFHLAVLGHSSFVVDRPSFAMASSRVESSEVVTFAAVAYHCIDSMEYLSSMVVALQTLDLHSP